VGQGTSLVEHLSNTTHCHYPKGGDAIWGNETWAPDDEPEASHSHGALISFRREMDVANGAGVAEQTKNMTAEMVGNWILERTPNSFQVIASFGIAF
jgi:phospholipid:diacylglycerol acyltransferase